jgi:hypothetical protein
MSPSSQPWTQSLQQFGQGLQGCATAAALAIGALWTYWLFVRTRQHAPRAELSHAIVARPISESQCYVGVTLFIKNVGDVAIRLSTAETTVQRLEPWPSPLPTKLCVPEIAEPESLPTSGELAWPSAGTCTVSLKDCHVEPHEQHATQFDFVLDGHATTIHVYSHVENVDIKRHGKTVPVGWSWRSTHVISKKES